MKVIVSAGGTGGHIYPAVAIINKIKEMEPDSEFLYIGTEDRMEKDIIPAMGIKFIGMKITGFRRKLTLDNLRTIKYFLNAIKEAKKIIKEFKPDIVIGCGGYVTGAVIYAAKKLKVKTFIHEQNSIPGLANRFLKRYADMTGVSFEETIKCFKKNKAVYTGNPAGEEALKLGATTKQELGIAPYKPLVLIVMGSLGANRVNNFMIETIPSFKEKYYTVIYVTGEKYYEKTNKEADLPNNVFLKSYIKDIAKVFKISDLIVTRAGATTISEINVLGIPSIMIPSPFVPDDHQTKNALELVKAGASLMIEEKDLTKEILLNNIDKILDNPILKDQMKQSNLKIGIKDSASRIYEELKKLIGDK